MNKNVERILDSKFGKLTVKFCNSPLYAVSIGAVCILSHTLDIPVVGALLLTILTVPALVFCKNSLVLAPFFMMCSFVMSDKTMPPPKSDYYNSPAIIASLCILLVILLSAFAFHLVFYKKWKVIFRRAYLTASIAITSGVLLVGGFTTESFVPSGVWTALSIAATTFLPYAFMINCGEYEGRKTVENFIWSLIVSSLVIGAAVLEQYIIYDFNITDKGSMLQFGYLISNTAAAVVVIALPLTFYFVYIYKRGYWFMLLVALELLIIVATESRASILVAVPGVIIVSAVMCFKKKTGRIGYYIMFGLEIAAVIAVSVIFRNKFADIMSSLMSGDFKDSGRIWLWRIGFESWVEHPLFGIGLWFLPEQYGLRYFSFHCTPITYLYCCGIIGLIGYIYHRYKTVRLTFSAKLTPERVFLALAVLAFAVNALLDIGMTHVQHLLYYGMILALIECDVRKVKAEAQSIISDKSSAVGDDVNKSFEETQNNINNIKTTEGVK